MQYVWLAYVLLLLQGFCLRIDSIRSQSGLVLIPISLLAVVIYFEDRNWVPRYTSEPPKTPGDIRVLHANVLYTRDEYDTTIALIRQQHPNLYVLQEMTPQSIRLVTSELHNEFPHWFACWSKGPCWVLVGSRTPFKVDQGLARKWRVVSLKTRVKDQDVALVTVHPRTPILPSWFRERNAQLAHVANATRQSPLPTVLIGDFNISVFSPIYKDIFETNDNEQKASLKSARSVLTQPTWPRFIPPMMIPIDHAFVNSGFYTQSFQTLEHPGSDHKAVVVDLGFTR
ncbi:endonuclease/exonuclease/phosphatase family protein [Spirosoma soli]|uniref:Endonuclease/exonuclease/phosphatase family protein n=1 Tax=Spirosoma soli TaxID=1770529 RepID=A0ABW5MBA0_9BACT